MYRAAIIQTAPVLLEREETIQKAVDLVGQAAAQGAGLIVLPEAFLPGYPAWIWRLRPGTDWDLSEALHARLLANAVDLERGDLAPLEAAARTHGVSVVCGMNEREGRLGRTTLYNTVVVIGPTGEILNRHRKLMPTNPERMVWGLGDGSGLKVVETPCGRLGTLICWESYMPLARYALYGQGIEIYVAPTYDSGEDWLGTLQHIAREGRCWVLGSGTLLRGSDIPADLPGRSVLYPDADEWVNPGDSVVIAPGGGIVAGPLHREEAILFAEIDRGRVGAARRALDVVGHYARPDIFRLHVDTQPQTPLELE